MNFKTIIPFILVLGMNPAQAGTDRIGAPVVGYVEIQPGICQVDFSSDDNQIYTFTEDCSDV